MPDPLVDEQTRATFVAACVAAKVKVFGTPEACPWKVTPNVIGGVSGPEFMVTIREETGFVSERLAEIVSPHAPVVFLSLAAVLNALAALKAQGERRAAEEGGDSLVGAGG